ncbi:MAG: site-specific DNA-methyltransferase, partial [Planctomycetaceae bacterium]|nr:site-specific DNA-methyltransferase [Planctomycetaceae bacterium]
MIQRQTFQNTLYTNDNLYVLSGLNSGLVDLIYLDPPFNTKRTYSAPVGSRAAGVSFKDMWTWEDVNVQYLDTLATKYPELTKYIATVGGIHGKAMMAYLTYMAQRVIEMHRVLKDIGSLYLHCDPTASHYLKLLLDSVFGKQGFRNEIVWYYSGGGASTKQWAKKHDTLFFYSKSGEWTFNVDEVRQPYKWDKGQKRADGSARDYEKGKLPDDVMILHGVMPWSSERVGYPTQKPLALLHRIIKASSNEGGIVMDPFCGCATTCVAAQQLGRKWIGIDIEEKAVGILVERLSDDAGIFKDFAATSQLPVRTDVTFEPKSESVKKRLYEQQDGKCNGCGHKF